MSNVGTGNCNNAIWGLESNGNPNAIPADLGSASARLNEPPSNAPNDRNPPPFSGDLFLVVTLLLLPCLFT